MNVPFLDLSWQERVIRSERERLFDEVIQSTSFTLGPQLAQFEQTFASYIGTEYAVGVSGGTTALGMIYRHLELSEGDEVITIPSTFIASITGLLYEGAVPVFVDIDRNTRNFNIAQLKAAITHKTKAILAVHMYGVPADMDSIREIADAHGVPVIEDACQAHGARHKDRRVGSIGDAAAFSFYPGKNLGAYGDGGAITTNSTSLERLAKALRNQGCVVKYDHEYLGYNGRLDTLQAAVLSAKLPHLDSWNVLRRGIAQRYLEAFSTLPLELPYVLPDTEAVWHLFVVRVPDGLRDAFMSHMREANIATGIHYPVPLHLTKAMAYLGGTSGDFPEAERLATSCVSLPIYPGMTDEQVEWVISSVHSFFHEQK